MTPPATSAAVSAAPVTGAPRLTAATIREIVASGRHLLVQGGMGLHASDGLAGKVAAARSSKFVTVGTVSAVGKTPEMLRKELRRAFAEAPGGFVGVNLMAAILKEDFTDLAKVSIEEGVSFIVQGAGISREIVRWCKDSGVPFAGIVSSGRLAAMYEKWGAEFLVAEGAEAGGHIGDIGHAIGPLVEEVVGATKLPVVAAGGIDGADVRALLGRGAAGVQLATRFIASTDGDTHRGFKEMHLGKTADDVVVIKSCVKGMAARAVRNPFTEALARGERFPPRSKAWFFGKEGYRGRTKACIECLSAEVCLCRQSDFKESFCITDALLRGAILGDTEKGLFYSGSSVTRIPEKTYEELKSVQEIVTDLERALGGDLAVVAPG
ncbi:MAG: nitronate monooxygenase [Anaeromyxobacter sp.]